MLEDARGTNCQASNFCKTVGVLAQSKSTSYECRDDLQLTFLAALNQIELIDYGRDSPDVDWANIIQGFNRFLIDRLNMEARFGSRNPLIVPRTDSQSSTAPPASPITQLMGIDAKNVVICTNCKATREKDNLTHILDMIYPRVVRPMSSQISYLTVDNFKAWDGPVTTRYLEHIKRLAHATDVSSGNMPIV
jgi:PAB-dependent poly(A)-specific ribonuclease subunit 2